MENIIEKHGFLVVNGQFKYCPFTNVKNAKCGAWCPLFIEKEQTYTTGKSTSAPIKDVSLNCAPQKTTYIIDKDEREKLAK